MSEDTTVPPEIGPSNGFSFVKNTASKDYAVLNELVPRIFTDVQNDLRNIDRAISRAELLTSNGDVLTVKGEKFNVSPSDLQRLVGAEAWAELLGIVALRPALKQLGFESATKGRPAVFVEAQGNTVSAGIAPTGTALAMVEERMTRGAPGDMPIKRVVTTPTTKRTPLTAPPAPPVDKA